MKIARIILVLAVFGAIAIYYVSQLGNHKQDVEYYGGRG